MLWVYIGSHRSQQNIQLKVQRWLHQNIHILDTNETSASWPCHRETKPLSRVVQPTCSLSEEHQVHHKYRAHPRAFGPRGEMLLWASPSNLPTLGTWRLRTWSYWVGSMYRTETEPREDHFTTYLTSTAWTWQNSNPWSNQQHLWWSSSHDSNAVLFGNKWCSFPCNLCYIFN